MCRVDPILDGPFCLVLSQMFFVCLDYKRSEGFKMKPEQQSVTSSSQMYDTDAFDSMAVMNSEIWNLGEGETDDRKLTSTDLLPNVRIKGLN